MSVSDEAGAPNRAAVTVCLMLATVMNALDTTIANVALPHLQGNVSAGADQITWVLTSYIIAGAIGTPLTGWLAGRFGRKRIFLVAVAGFTAASMLCGLANSLPEIVAFRVLQGLLGAPLVPLSQSLLLDINPPEKHGQAMSIWGAGTLVGPIMGPTLGGWLTDNLSWRWCFYINLPVGILAFVGIWIFLSADKPGRRTPLDFLGFGALVVFASAFQLMLDRGAGLDWFASTEIWVEAIVAAAALWVFLIHTLSARRPFLDPVLFRDRNFLTACIFIFFVNLLMMSNMTLAPPMLQGLMGYSVMQSGLVMAPRGLGSLVGMLMVGRLVGRVDTRQILVAGLAICAFALWQMSRYDLSMDARPVIIAGFFQGMGSGMLSVPISTLAFATLPAAFRAEGSSIFSLIRSLGSSVGISLMQVLAIRNAQAMHESMAARVIPSDPVVGSALSSGQGGGGAGVLAQLDAEIGRQSTMVAYVDDYRLMFAITLFCMPMVLLLRKPRPRGEPIHVDAE